MNSLETKPPEKRWNLDCELVYGPISSRRFGISLGINLLPSGQKVCDFDCLYCQCGWSERALAGQGFAGVPFPSLKEIEEKVYDAFQRLGSEGRQPDVIIFSGNGEPTLHPRFSEAVEVVRRARERYLPGSRIGILTNGGRLLDPKIFATVASLEMKSVKFDAGGEWLDRPLRDHDLEKLVPAWKKLQGLTIQSFFSLGRFDNTTLEFVNPWLERLREIQPQRVQIYTLDRVPPVSAMCKATAETLSSLASRVKESLGIEVDVFG